MSFAPVGCSRPVGAVGLGRRGRSSGGGRPGRWRRGRPGGTGGEAAIRRAAADARAVGRRDGRTWGAGSRAPGASLVMAARRRWCRDRFPGASVRGLSRCRGAPSRRARCAWATAWLDAARILPASGSGRGAGRGLCDPQGRTDAVYEDRTLTCRDCGDSFIFSGGEQRFFAEKGLQNVPQRCPTCRANAKRVRMGGPANTTPPSATPVATRRWCPSPRAPIDPSIAAAASTRFARARSSRLLPRFPARGPVRCLDGLGVPLARVGTGSASGTCGTRAGCRRWGRCGAWPACS